VAQVSMTQSPLAE